MSTLIPIRRGYNTFTNTNNPYAFATVFNEMLEDTFRNTSNGNNTNVPKANIVRNNTGYTINLAVPGYSREEFETTVENNTLTIHLNAENTVDNVDSTVYREYQFETFTRNFSLPDNTNVDAITATYIAGILVVNVPVTDNVCTTRTITVE